MNDKEIQFLTTTSGVKGNVRYITITDNIPDHWDTILSIIKASYTWYAYIYHDQDKDTAKHLHVLAYDEGGTSLKAHCARFSSVVPSNFVLKVYNPRAMARYLTHKDYPDKHQYPFSAIVTNGLDKLSGFYKDLNNDCTQEFNDYKQVRMGLMSVTQFLEKYRGEFASMPFYHKLNCYSRLMDGIINNNNQKGAPYGA